MIGQTKDVKYITALRNFYAGGDFVAKGETKPATHKQARALKGSGQVRDATVAEIEAYKAKHAAPAKAPANAGKGKASEKPDADAGKGNDDAAKE